jgi:hypothetical protein
MVAMRRAISEFSFLTAAPCPVIRDASWDASAFRGVRGERSAGRLAIKDAISGKQFGTGNVRVREPWRRRALYATLSRSFQKT